MSNQRFQTGESVDKYLIEQKIGAGGMGEVWKALRQDGSPVAIKFAHKQLAGDAYFKDFTRQEASMNLVHPNIVRVVDFFEAEGLPAIVFDYVDGVDLESEIYGSAAAQDFGQPLPVQGAVRIASDILAALDFAHQAGLVHRDVKSSNILLERQTGKALLSDFGLVMDVAVRRMTRYGMMAGCVPYMSPEQIRDNRSVDLRSDIYSFGIVLYEMLTGVLPFRKEPGETEDPDYLIKHKHRYTPAVPPGTLNPQVPPALDTIVLKALEKDRNLRYLSCGDFALDLRKFISTPPKRVFMPEISSGTAFPAPPRSVEDTETAIRAGQFSLSARHINSFLPWALIGCSALIVLIALILHFR
jgi:serine/threonine-protein kinase